MADAVIDLQASNLFSLSANFKTSASSTSQPSTNVTVLDESGNVECEQNVVDIINYTQSASYCGSDLKGDLGTFLTDFGAVQGSKAITSLTLNFTAAGYVTIDIQGHNHISNAHSTGLVGSNMSAFLPSDDFTAFDGFGVPGYGIAVTDASAISCTVTFTMTHVDQVTGGGAHLTGTNITPRAELSMDFSGIPDSTTFSAIEANLAALNTASGILDAIVDSTDKNDSNTDFDSFSFTAHGNSVIA